MTEEEFRIRLNVNKPVTIFDMNAKSYTMNEVLDELGYVKFNRLRNFVNLTIDNFEDDMVNIINDHIFNVKEYLMMEFPNIGYNFDIDLFDMVCYVPFINEMFIEFLATFTTHKIERVDHTPIFDEMLITYDFTNDGNKNLVLSRDKFNEFIDWFSIMNYSVKVDRNPIKDSDEVREFDKRSREVKEKFGWKDHQDVTLESIMSALIDSDNTSYNHENICCKTIYQILVSFHRMCKLKENEFMNLIRVNSSSIKEEDIKKSVWYYNIY